MSFAFKRFNFFQQQELNTHGCPSNACCFAHSASVLYAGCDNGNVVGLDSEFQTLFSFVAHAYKVLDVKWLEIRNLLITVGVEEPGISSATVKIWEGEKLGSSPQPGRTLKAFSTKYPESDIMSVAVKETASGSCYVALGLGSGIIYILQADLAGKGKLHHTMKLNSRPDHSDLWCVNSVEFVGSDAQMNLFAVTESQTLAFNLQSGVKTILDQAGTQGPSCSLLKDEILIVARDDALYDYALDSRAGCSVFEGKKQQLEQLRRYLLVVTNESNDYGVTSSTIYVADVKNKLLAGQATLVQVQKVVCAWGIVAVFLGSGKVVIMRELDLGFQLDTLFKRSLHKLALEVAKARQVSVAVLAHIHQRWGDHLYSKSEYDAAMSQYLETIGQLEPSYVIRRFLDAQRIHHLTTYLEALHERGLASSDHTTLLLNCYTKVKDVTKLDRFLHRDHHQPGTQLAFDAETAVKVLRAAGYAEHALWVAERMQETHWMLDIFLEDMAAYTEALAFLETLPRKSAAAALKKYGKVLISARPEDTTRLLMDLCITPASGSDMYTASVADFAHLYADQPTALLLLCEFILNSSQAASPANELLLYHTLLELYLQPQSSDKPAAAADSAAAHAQQQQQGRSELAPQSPGMRALELLQRGWPPHLSTPKYDPHHCLVLCRTHDFREGLIFLYDKMGLVKEVLQVHMSYGDHVALVGAAAQYGDASRGGDPQLWAEVLEYFVMQPGDCTAQVMEVMEHIEKGKILPPLVVLQTLAKNPRLKVSSIRGYVARQLQREAAEVARDREQITRLQGETQVMKEEVVKLKTQAHVFQNSRCTASNAPLELPVVHFLCGHSYNLRALGDNDRECPLCAPEFRRVSEIKRSMAMAAAQQDRFFTELRQNADGFTVIAENFGRCLMNVVTPPA